MAVSSLSFLGSSSQPVFPQQVIRRGKAGITGHQTLGARDSVTPQEKINPLRSRSPQVKLLALNTPSLSPWRKVKHGICARSVSSAIQFQAAQDASFERELLTDALHHSD